MQSHGERSPGLFLSCVASAEFCRVSRGCRGTIYSVISVPTPSFVKISSSREWGTRPSMIWTLAQPASRALKQDVVLGIMPPAMTPEATNSSTFFLFRLGISFLSLSRMPAWSVSRMSFSALSAPATAPATRSALILYVSPFGPAPTGAITGIKPPWSSACSAPGRTSVTSPTSPISMISVAPVSSDFLVMVSFFAWTRPPSLPVRPTALPPAWLMRFTISLFTLPPRTISTMSMVSSSVTRWPETNVGFFPIRSMVLPILVDEVHDLLVHLAAEDHLHDVHGLFVGDALARDERRLFPHPLHGLADLGPAAVHDHGVDADVAHEDDVPGEPCFRASSVMALPPYLITKVL